MGETKRWDLRKTDYQERMSGAAPYISNGKVVAAHDVTKVLEAVIRPFDRVNIEGNNQKQADFLAEAWQVRSAAGHGLHMVQSVLPLAVHLDLSSWALPRSSISPFGAPGRRVAQLIDGRQDRDRGHPHVPGAVRPLFRRPDAEGCAGLRVEATGRQPLHRPQHRGHAGDGGGGGVPPGHRHRPGQQAGG